MQTIDSLLLARWLLPIAPVNTVLEHHALAIDAGCIVDCLPIDEALVRYDARSVRRLDRHALMPGLVNLHAHMAMSLLRGFADDLPLMDWLQNHIWPTEGAHVSPTFCEDGVRLAAAEMIRGGITCANDMYFFPDVSARVMREIGMRGKVGLLVFDFPTPWAEPDQYIPKGIATQSDLAGDPLVGGLWAPHAPYTVSDHRLRLVRQQADALDIGIHMHVHETAGEVEGAVNEQGQRPWRRLKDLGLLGEDFIAVHMTQLTPWEIEEAAHFGVHIAHCPESNLKLASGFCPVDALLEAGVNVGIGTDGSASNNDLDMFGELRTASLLAKAVAGKATALPAAKALEMATLGGARALGLGDMIGSLERGKAADVIAVDLSDLNTQPVHNVISQLAYAVNARQVSDVWVAGRALLTEGRLTTIVHDEVRDRVNYWQKKLKS